MVGLPFIIDGSVHLGLQLVGASADGPPVATSPLGAGIFLKVLLVVRGKGDRRRHCVQIRFFSGLNEP